MTKSKRTARCPICGKMFTEVGLPLHMKTHEGPSTRKKSEGIEQKG